MVLSSVVVLYIQLYAFAVLPGCGVASGAVTKALRCVVSFAMLSGAVLQSVPEPRCRIVLLLTLK